MATDGWKYQRKRAELFKTMPLNNVINFKRHSFLCKYVQTKCILGGVTLEVKYVIDLLNIHYHYYIIIIL